MKKNILIILLIGICTYQQAQVTGYLGKKFMVKTNIINGRFLPLSQWEVEYVAGRRFSINAAYRFFSYGRDDKGVTVNSGKIKPGDRNQEFTEKSTLTNGKTSGWLAYLGLKLYFNKIIPAPWGYYLEFNVGKGSAEFSNYSISYEYKSGSMNFGTTELYRRKPVSGLSGKAGILFFEAPALGYQRILKRFIVIDGKVGLEGQYCKLPDNLLNALEHNYYVRSNTLGYARNGLYLGLAIHLKLGVLLF